MANRLANSLSRLRAASTLGVGEFASLAGVDPAQLERAERGEDALSADALERCARLGGLEVRDLLRGVEPAEPLRVLFRAVRDSGGQYLDGLREANVALLLGDLAHHARVVAALEAAMGHRAQSLPVVPRAPEREGEHPAEEDALRARTLLGVGDTPIPSMRELLERFGVLLVWVASDEAPLSLDGASLREPRATVLVHLVNGPECYWRTRMTLAHELGHLLFDHLRRGAAAMYSPSHDEGAARVKGPFAEFDGMERGADAFAACFLAPRELVRKRVDARDPTSEEAIAAVGAHFGIGRTVAINRLQHTFGLSGDVRAAMELRRNWHRYEAQGRGDIVDRNEIGFRQGAYRKIVLAALAAGQLTKLRTYELLGVPPSEPLPDAPTPELRAPLLPRWRTMLDRANQVLDQHGAKGYSALNAEPLSGGTWRVLLARGAGRPVESPASMDLSEDGSVIATDPPSLLEAV